MRKNGVFTLPTLQQFNSEDIVLEILLKRSSIYFDRIILSESIPTNFKFSKILAHNLTGALVPLIKQRLSNDFANSSNFNEIFTSTKEYDDLFNLVKEQQRSVKSPLVSEDHLKNFIKCVSSFPSKSSNHQARQFEILLNLDNIYNDHLLYENLSKYLPDYSGILSPQMGTVLKNVLNINPLSLEKLVEIIASVQLFDFGQLTWSNIMELRRSEFASSFRDKLEELFKDYYGVDSLEEVTMKIDEYIKDSKFKFIEAKYPNPKMTFLTGVLGTVNMPFSIFSTIYDTAKDKSNNSKYSWLYFINEGRKRSNDT